jgi:SAM-dependent methyltransferase
LVEGRRAARHELPRSRSGLEEHPISRGPNVDGRSKIARRIVHSFRNLVSERVRSLIPTSLRRAGWRLLAGPSDARQAEQWGRLVMNRHIDEVIKALPPQGFDAIEISGDLRTGYPWRSYTRTHYPEFDLSAPLSPPETYSFVICEQVLEHTQDPWQAARNLRQICRPDGFVLVNTPFLIRIHDSPVDYWRFTPEGLRALLSGAALDVLWVRSWGNRRCARANFRVWARYRPWHSLRNEERFPLVVWALATPRH